MSGLSKRGLLASMTHEARHLEFTVNFYAQSAGLESYDISSVRGGHGDAAHMCDVIAKDIEAENTRNGRVTNRGQALAAAVRRAGNAIWVMREALKP